MPPRQYLTTAQKLQCIGMLQAGESPNQVARLFGKSKSVLAWLAALPCQTGDVRLRRGRETHDSFYQLLDHSKL